MRIDADASTNLQPSLAIGATVGSTTQVPRAENHNEQQYQPWLFDESILLMEAIVKSDDPSWKGIHPVYDAAVKGNGFTERTKHELRHHYNVFDNGIAFSMARDIALANEEEIDDEEWTQEENDLIENLERRVKESRPYKESGWPSQKEHYAVFLGAVAKLDSKHHTRTVKEFKRQARVLEKRSNQSKRKQTTPDRDPMRRVKPRVAAIEVIETPNRILRREQATPRGNVAVDTARATAPSPSPTRATAPSPAPTRVTAPSPAPARATTPSPAPVRATAPSPPLMRATAPSPPLMRATAPSPAPTRATAPSPRLMSQVDASVRDDKRDDTMQSAPILPARDRAFRMFARVMERLLGKEPEMAKDRSWTIEVADLLKITHDDALNTLLVDVVTALLNELQGLAPADTDAVRNDTIQEILDVLADFPSRDLYDVGDDDSEECVEAQWLVVETQWHAIENSFTAALRDGKMLDVIEKIIRGLKACIDRKRAMLNCKKKAETNLERVQGSEREGDDIARARHAAALKDVQKDLVHIESTSVPLMAEKTVYMRNFDRLLQAKTHLDVVQQQAALRQETEPRFVKWMERSAKHLNIVDNKITWYVDTLSVAMAKFFEHHNNRQKFLSEKLVKTRQEKADDEEFALGEADDFNEKIKRLEREIKQSTDKMGKVMLDQRDVWNGTNMLVSQSVQDKVEKMHINLKNTLTEEYSKDVRAAITNMIREQPQPAASWSWKFW